MAAPRSERGLEALSRRQHGVFRREQASALGFTERMIDHRLANGEWIRLTTSVYAMPAAPATWKRQAKAAELSVIGSAVSHRAAAVLHQIPGFRAGNIDLSTSRGRDTRSPLARVHRRTSSLPTMQIDRITTTTLVRTVLDVAAVVPASTFAAVVDDLVVGRRLHVEALRQEYAVLAPTRCRGIGVVRRLLDDRIDGAVPAANELERALHRLLSDPRLPAPEHQAAYPWWPEGSNRVDAFLPSWRRIVEADGRRWHSREADFDRDRGATTSPSATASRSRGSPTGSWSMLRRTRSTCCSTSAEGPRRDPVRRQLVQLPT
jgi:hypothetical protein